MPPFLEGIMHLTQKRRSINCLVRIDFDQSTRAQRAKLCLLLESFQDLPVGAFGIKVTRMTLAREKSLGRDTCAACAMNLNERARQQRQPVAGCSRLAQRSRVPPPRDQDRSRLRHGARAKGIVGHPTEFLAAAIIQDTG